MEGREKNLISGAPSTHRLPRAWPKHKRTSPPTSLLPPHHPSDEFIIALTLTGCSPHDLKRKTYRASDFLHQDHKAGNIDPLPMALPGRPGPYIPRPRQLLSSRLPYASEGREGGGPSSGAGSISAGDDRVRTSWCWISATRLLNALQDGRSLDPQLLRLPLQRLSVTRFLFLVLAPFSA